MGDSQCWFHVVWSVQFGQFSMVCVDAQGPSSLALQVIQGLTGTRLSIQQPLSVQVSHTGSIILEGFHRQYLAKMLQF